VCAGSDSGPDLLAQGPASVPAAPGHDTVPAPNTNRTGAGAEVGLGPGLEIELGLEFAQIAFPASEGEVEVEEPIVHRQVAPRTTYMADTADPDPDPESDPEIMHTRMHPDLPGPVEEAAAAVGAVAVAKTKQKEGPAAAAAAAVAVAVAVRLQSRSRWVGVEEGPEWVEE
jgi:hypothetical protein